MVGEDFDLPYDATIGDGSLNTNSDSLMQMYIFNSVNMIMIVVRMDRVTLCLT